MIQKLINKIVTRHFREYIHKVRCNLFNGYATESYSQEGEDLILRRIFETKPTGFYVDVGAHHPKRFSNTYFFYKIGWRGINIDPMPNSMHEFRKERPDDTNIECGIAVTEGELSYYIFEEYAINTFSESLANERINKGHKLLKTQVVKIYPLSSILDKYLPYKQAIDFMSIDAEGFEMQILISNNWNKHRPYIIIVESLDFDIMNLQQSEIYKKLTSLQYRLCAKTVNSLFFIDKV